jgi:NAD+ kinase
VKKVGICFPARSEPASRLAYDLRDRLHAEGVPDVWLCPAWDAASAEHVPGTDLLLCVGGDGTVLWGARSIAGEATLLLGINMGRLGFLTEISEADIRDKLGDVLRGAGRVEARAMLETEPPSGGFSVAEREKPIYALNDVVVSRGAVGRPVIISVSVDGTEVAVYHCDAVIVATATGSTGYSLSAGGPILHPESRDIVVAPVAVHFSQHASLVLPSSAEVSLTVHTEHSAILSIDGQDDIDLFDGATVNVRQSPHSAHFLRLSPPADFYENLSRRLAWLWAKEGLLNNRES